MDEKLIDNPEQEQTVLAKIRVTIGFSQATLAWFKEIQKLYKESQIWFTEKEGDLIFSRFKNDWEKFLKDLAEKETKEYFVKLGIPVEKLPSIKVTIYQYKGCLELMLLIAIIGVTIQFFAEYPNIKKGIKELSEDFYKHIINPIKTRLGKRVSDACYRLLKDEASKLELPLPPPEEELISIDVRPIVSDADISELVQLMFVGLLGANKEIEKVLKDFHERYDKPAHGFLFYEYLLHQPLHSKWSIENTWIIYPFPHRIARRTLVMIRPKDASQQELPFEFSTDEDIAQTVILGKMKHSNFVKHIYERWKDPNYDNEKRLTFKTLNVPFIDPQEFNEDKPPFLAKINNFNLEVLQGIVNKNHLGKMDLTTAEAYRILYGIEYPQFAPLANTKQITSFFIPITSSEVFYGALNVCVPHFKYPDDESIIELLASELLRCIKKHYVPALALIHEHFFEKLVAQDTDFRKAIREKASTPEEKTQKQKKLVEALMKDYDLKVDGSAAKYKSPICRHPEIVDEPYCFGCPDFGWEESSDNVVEKYLHKLWQDRKTGRTDIEESLVFKNRLNTDPKTLELYEDFLKPSKAKLDKDGNLLPSILVVAPPGSGKESIPRLLKLFSDCYNRGRLIKLNMASIKPDAIVPVTMMGGEVTWQKSIYLEGKHKEEGMTPQDIRLMGILYEVREQTKKEFEDFVYGKGTYEGKCLYKKAEEYEKNLETCYKTISEKSKNLKNLKKWTESISNGLPGYIKKIDELNRQIRKKEKLAKKVGEKHAIVERLCTHLKNLRGNNWDVKKIVKELTSSEKLIVKELFGKFPTIVLDELNSMTIESQGVLLRFLENAEIVPIGGYEDRMTYGEEEKDYREFITDFLVVGLMNEPEEITREKAIRFLRQKDNYMSGFLGDLLYEHILRMRRLRPDLRQRMMRNGRLLLPPVEERRADIPGAFYQNIEDLKENYFVRGDVIRINMDALEYLMRPDLEWPENFRLVETLAKKVMEVIYEDYEDKREPITQINGKDLIIVREKHIRKAMKEIGMIKE